jgi:hypothetical protein
MKAIAIRDYGITKAISLDSMISSLFFLLYSNGFGMNPEST